MWEHQLLGLHAQAANETRAARVRRARRPRRLVQEDVAGEVGSRRHCANRKWDNGEHETISARATSGDEWIDKNINE